MAKKMWCVSEILFGLRPHPEDLRGEAQLGLVLHILIGQKKNCVMDLPVDLVDFVKNFMVYQEKTFKIKLCVGILGVEWLTLQPY